MFDDEENEVEYENTNERLYSNTELCAYVKNVLEEKYGIIIYSIDIILGYFEFSVLASNQKELHIPSFWTPLSFGNDLVSFKMSLDDFQIHCDKLEERDYIDAVKAAFQAVYGDIITITRIENYSEDRLYHDSIKVIATLKPDCIFDNRTAIPVSRIKGDTIEFEVSGFELDSLHEYIDNHRSSEWDNLLSKNI